jgi:hypothetical protein
MPIFYNNAFAKNVTNPTVVYNPTTANVQATMIGLTICNNTSNTATANVTIYDGVSVTANIARNVIIPVGTSLSILDSNRIIVEQNQSINVSSTFSVDVVVSVIEVT